MRWNLQAVLGLSHQGLFLSNAINIVKNSVILRTDIYYHKDIKKRFIDANSDWLNVKLKKKKY